MEQRKGSVTITKASLCTPVERWRGGCLRTKTSKPAQFCSLHLLPEDLPGALCHLQIGFVHSCHYSRAFSQCSLPRGDLFFGRNKVLAEHLFCLILSVQLPLTHHRK